MYLFSDNYLNDSPFCLNYSSNEYNDVMIEFTCPICGFDKLSNPHIDAYGCASFDVCPSCGNEFGYDDVTTPHALLRQRWIDNGKKWWCIHGIPLNWDAGKQLTNLGKS